MNETKEIMIVPEVKNQTLSVINWNYADIKLELEGFLKEYNEYVVTEATLPQDKKTRASLNSISKSIGEFRKNTKKEILKPVDIFEEQCNELAGMVENVSSKIDASVKEFETVKKEEKRIIAQGIIAELSTASGLPKDYTDRIEFKESFTNLTATKTQVETDISEQIIALNNEFNQFQQNVEVIKSTLDTANKRIKTKLFLDDYVGQLKYKSIAEIITLINTRTEQIEKSEIPVAEEPAKIIVPKIETPKAEEPILTVQYEINGTKAQLIALVEFIKTNGLTGKKLN